MTRLESTRQRQTAIPKTPHEHGWSVESRHATSLGVVLYVRCACGVRRVDLRRTGDVVPDALTPTLPR
ncbi:hypothetical protein G9U51_10395 [Calidifontibacter sp. DB0510]|uniref:Uncharacterized protein n=1 Tax=Metallococcus carri TaxID=1656884 RepID=A0A967B7J1_9MICO|nr:hypothetical protein [Metallococcus carri]NHN56186.1 hypothetical protein [Metallococcus carri]NOP38763.1 hypothetical protein [Calidifontibacter sp. DB2511S]